MSHEKPLYKSTYTLHYFTLLERLHAKFHLNVFIVSVSGGQKPQFCAYFDIFGGSCTTPFLPMRAKFGVLEQTQGLHLQAKFHLNVLIRFRWPKPTILVKFWHFWELLYRPPVTDEGQIWCAIGLADPRFTFTCDISSRSVYSVVLWRRKTPIFAVLGFGI